MKIEQFNINRLEYSELPYTKITRDEILYRDDKGIPLRNWKGKLLYHPVFLIDHALFLINDFRNNDIQILSIASKLINISMLLNNALWIPYPFNFQLHGRNETMEGTWYSCMSQGMALSLFCRIQNLKPSENLTDIIELLYNSLKIQKDEPSVSCIEYDYYWLEEYLLKEPAHTLNGMIFAIYGLYDYYLMTGNGELLNSSLTTIKHNIDKFKANGLSYYCLKHKIQDQYYHNVHKEQLKMLYRMTNDDKFLIEL